MRKDLVDRIITNREMICPWCGLQGSSIRVPTDYPDPLVIPGYTFSCSVCLRVWTAIVGFAASSNECEPRVREFDQ